jgi:dihydrofolate reductase
MSSPDKSSITLVVAAAENGVIGRDGGLPWRLPADLAHFKAVTMGKPIVMGRKTWESIGRPLPGRTNVVVTGQPDYEAPGCVVTHSFEAALAAGSQTDAEEIMIVGGAALYAAALPRADRILLTRVHAAVEGDTFFPALADEEWELVAIERHEADERHPSAYSFIELRRVC